LTFLSPTWARGKGRSSQPSLSSHSPVPHTHPRLDFQRPLNRLKCFVQLWLPSRRLKPRPFNGIVGSVNNTTANRSFTNNTITWINAVHQKKPPSISIFTRIYFSTTQRLEIVPTSLFSKMTADLRNATECSPASQLHRGFKPLNSWDPVLPKTGSC
jgi:hypothetical protein